MQSESKIASKVTSK